MSEEHLIDSVVRPPGDRTAGQPCPSRPAEVREAVLRAVAERCQTTRTPCDTEALADALLVASELITNAILHGGGVTGFEVDVDGPGVLLSVSDRSDALPVAVPAVDDQGRLPPRRPRLAHRVPAGPRRPGVRPARRRQADHRPRLPGLTRPGTLPHLRRTRRQFPRRSGVCSTGPGAIGGSCFGPEARRMGVARPLRDSDSSVRPRDDHPAVDP